MTSMRGSIRSTQAKIASLLDSLVSNEVFINEDIEQIRNTSNKLLDNYKSNLHDMQTEFLEILQRMKDGNYSLKEFEVLMEAEKVRGSETLNIAAEVVELINEIFGIIREVVVLSSRSKENMPLPEEIVKNIAKSLDMASLKVSSIGRIASSSTGNVSRAINLAHIERADLEAHPQRGFFASTLQRMYSNEDIKKQYSRKHETSSSFHTTQVTTSQDNNSSPDQSNQTPKLKIASVRIRAQTSVNFESEVSNSPTSPSPQNSSNDITESYRHISTTSNMKYMLKSNEFKKANNNKEKPEILSTYPNAGGGVNSRGSLFAADTTNITNTQIESTTLSSKVRLKARLATSRVFTVTVKQEVISSNSSVDPNLNNSFSLPTQNISKNSISKYSPKIKLATRASSSSSKKRVIGAKEREKGKSVIDALILSEELKQLSAVQNPDSIAAVDSDEEDEGDSEADTAVVLPLDVAGAGAGPSNSIKLKPVTAPPSLRDGNHRSTRRAKPSPPHLHVSTDYLAAASTSSSMSPSTAAAAPLPHCLFARPVDLLRIIPLIVSFLPLQLPEVTTTTAAETGAPSAMPGLLLPLEVDGFLPTASASASGSSSTLYVRRNAMQQDPVQSTLTSMLAFSSSSKTTLPEVFLPAVAAATSNDSNPPATAPATVNRPFLSAIGKPKSMNHTNMSNRLNALNNGRSKSTRKIFDDYNSGSTNTSQINSTASSASSSTKGSSGGNGSYRNANTSKFVETIVIYPVNTVNRETSTIDLEGMTSTTTTTSSSITLTTTTTRGSVSCNYNTPHHPMNVSVDSPSGSGSTGGSGPICQSPVMLKLSSSENPLLLLYETYKNDLSELCKSRFLSAVSGESNSSNSLPILSKVFANVIQEMEKLRTAVMSVDCTVTACEESLRVLASGGGDNTIKYEERRQELGMRLFNDLGSVSSSLLLLQLQFSEYRTMFERLISSEASRLPRLLQSCAAFNESYQIFVDCQGKLRTQQGRLLDLKGKCQRVYRQQPLCSNNADGMNNNNNNSSNIGGVEKLEKEILVLRSEMERNGSYIHQLEEELREAKSDLEGLRADFLDGDEDGDEGGEALASLQQVILHIGAFRTLVDGSETPDMPVLFQRLSVCVEHLHGLRQLVTVHSHAVLRLTARKPVCLTPPPRLGLPPNDDNYGGGTGAENYTSLSTVVTSTASSSITELRAFTAKGGSGGGGAGTMKQYGTSAINNKRGSRVSSSQAKGGGRDRDRETQEEGYASFFTPTRKPTYNENDFQFSEYKSSSTTPVTSSSKQPSHSLPTLLPRRKASNVGHNT